MCILCIEIQKDNLTVKEVARAYREFEPPAGHARELEELLDDKFGIDNVAEEMNRLYDEDAQKEYAQSMKGHD